MSPPAMTLMALMALMAGCAAPTHGGDSGGLAPSAVTQPGPPAPDAVTGWKAGRVLSSELRWHIDFDPTAEAEGYVDCLITRTYDQVRAQGMVRHLCPDCEFASMGSSYVTGDRACYGSLTDGAEGTQNEYWGVHPEAVYRNTALPLTGTLSTNFSGGVYSAARFSWTGSLALETGSATYEGDGAVSVWEDLRTRMPDPDAPRTEPYGCGWVQNDPGNLDDDAEELLRPGLRLPDAALADACDDPFWLHDLYGQAVVLIILAPDDPAAAAWASGVYSGAIDPPERGEPAQIITLLSASLDRPWDPATTEQLAAWTASHQPAGPVLADRGLGRLLLRAQLGDEALPDWGTPAWVHTDADLWVVAAGTAAAAR